MAGSRARKSCKTNPMVYKRASTPMEAGLISPPTHPHHRGVDRCAIPAVLGVPFPAPSVPLAFSAAASILLCALRHSSLDSFLCCAQFPLPLFTSAPKTRTCGRHHLRLGLTSCAILRLLLIFFIHTTYYTTKIRRVVLIGSHDPLIYQSAPLASYIPPVKDQILHPAFQEELRFS